MIQRMPIVRRAASIAQKLGTVLVTVPFFACSSSSQLEGIERQLSDLQTRVLEIQQRAATRDGVTAAAEQTRAEIESLISAQADTSVALESLATRIEQLGAKLEDTQFRLAQLGQQIAATNQELLAMRRAAESPAPMAPPPPVVVEEPDMTDPQALYDGAYSDFQNGNLDLAILGFRRYVDAFADTELTDNAAFWIGESYYRQRKFQEAVEQFDEVITRFPGSDRVPSALLKKGYAQLELGMRAEGVVQLQVVIREYPGTDEAQLAQQRLDALGIDAGA